MAMFGGGFANVLQTLGAALKDGSPGSEGGNLAALQGNQQRQALMQRQQALGARAAGLFGGGFANGGEGAAPIDTRRIASELAQIQAAGGDVGPYAQLLQFLQPKGTVAPNGEFIDQADPGNIGKRFAGSEYVNGFRVSPNDPTSPNFVPKLPEAMMPDGRGGAMNVPGSVDAAAAMAGGVTGAQERAKAPYNFQTFTGPTGAPTVVTGETAAALGGNGGIIAKGQTPAEAAAAKIQAEATAGAQVNLPQTNASAQEALALIDRMAKHPAIGQRTGLSAVLPAIPGSEGADFDAMASQLKGKVFLEAYATLKGAGAITEAEGQAARDAIARLNTRQSEAGYKSALSDLQKVIRAGADRAATKAGATPSRPGAAPQLAPPAVQRTPNTIYMTPRGPLTWTGTGWRQ